MENTVLAEAFVVFKVEGINEVGLLFGRFSVVRWQVQFMIIAPAHISAYRATAGLHVLLPLFVAIHTGLRAIKRIAQNKPGEVVENDLFCGFQSNYIGDYFHVS